MALSTMPTITRLDLARIELPEDHPAADLGRSVPVHGFVIEHPDGTILVDTGVGRGNPFIDEVYRPTFVDLAGLLAELDVDLASVVAVVNSHLHFDHCGQNPALFGGSGVFYAQKAELDAVEADRFYTDATWALAPARQRRALRGDEQIAEGVTVVATPGHTAGHQSVLVEAADHRVVIGAQVVWHGDELDEEVASSANVDDDPALRLAAVDSIRRLKALRPEVVHLSHCPAYHPTTGAW